MWFEKRCHHQPALPNLPNRSFFLIFLKFIEKADDNIIRSRFKNVFWPPAFAGGIGAAPGTKILIFEKASSRFNANTPGGGWDFTARAFEDSGANCPNHFG